MKGIFKKTAAVLLAFALLGGAVPVKPGESDLIMSAQAASYYHEGSETITMPHSTYSYDEDGEIEDEYYPDWQQYGEYFVLELDYTMDGEFFLNESGSMTAVISALDDKIIDHIDVIRSWYEGVPTISKGTLSETNGNVFTFTDINDSSVTLTGCTGDTYCSVSAVTIYYKELIKLPEFTTNSMTLGDAISLNFYIDLSAVPEDYRPYSYVEFEVNGKKQKAKFNPNKTNKAGAYGFNCVLNSISMADDVKATLYYYDKYGESRTLTHTASCETYLNKFNENDAEATWNIIKAINDYGYYMQQYLSEHSSGSWTLGVDHKAMKKSFMKPANYAQKQDTYVSELKKMKVQKVWGTNSDIEKVNYSLVLDSNTAINFKILKKDGYTGKFEVKLDDKKVTPKKIGDNRYQVTAGGISAHLLAEPHTVTVTTDHGTSTYKASALSYAYECLTDTHYNSEISAFGALYEYYKATIAYKAAQH